MSAEISASNIIRTALQRLGIERLVLSIHQASFPPSYDDIGYGTPYSERGKSLVHWLAGLGFTGVMLGPAGITGRANSSPYDATSLSRNPLHISLGSLCDRGLLDQRLLEDAIRDKPAGSRVAYDYAWVTQRRLVAAVARRRREDPTLSTQLDDFRRSAEWLEGEARYEAIAAAMGHEHWHRWPASPPQQPEAAERFWVSQLLVNQQHREFYQYCHQLGLRVGGDLAIGISHRDRFLTQSTFLPGYAMGAPPSRTNPSGQPWGYPVWHPNQLQADTGARHAVVTRFDAILQDHDSLRIDHPHGWICPWVYCTDDPDPMHAVQHGARLFSSPDLAEHPVLAAYARVRADQIDHSLPRHADNWVRTLEPTQVDRYASLFDLIVERIRAFSRDLADSMVEVLSTCPRPLAAVLARHRLGRFRVTQKANLQDPQDVYRSDRALPEDWIMVGNHDTPPLRTVVERWQGSTELAHGPAT